MHRQIWLAIILCGSATDGAIVAKKINPFQIPAPGSAILARSSVQSGAFLPFPATASGNFLPPVQFKAKDGSSLILVNGMVMPAPPGFQESWLAGRQSLNRRPGDPLWDDHFLDGTWASTANSKQRSVQRLIQALSVDGQTLFPDSLFDPFPSNWANRGFGRRNEFSPVAALMNSPITATSISDSTQIFKSASTSGRSFGQSGSFGRSGGSYTISRHGVANRQAGDIPSWMSWILDIPPFWSITFLTIGLAFSFRMINWIIGSA